MWKEQEELGSLKEWLGNLNKEKEKSCYVVEMIRGWGSTHSCAMIKDQMPKGSKWSLSEGDA